jgi:hypothetical protein
MLTATFAGIVITPTLDSSDYKLREHARFNRIHRVIAINAI